jgi:ribonuclease D
MYKTSITPEEINKLPVKSFEGEIILIDNLHRLYEAVDFLKTQTILGFDTETKPSFRKGSRNSNTVALLQFSTSAKAFLFRLNIIGLPESLISILSNGNILKIGAAIRDDIKVLQKLRAFTPSGFIDIQQYIKNFGIENTGVKKLAAIILKIKISKSQQLSNWESPALSDSQMRYAATDAWVCGEIFRKITGFV